MADTNEFPGKDPSEAWEIYSKARGEGITPQTVFNYVTDILTTLPETEAEMMVMNHDNFHALSQLLTAVSNLGSDLFEERSWLRIKDIAVKASKRVAEINAIHGSLALIAGIASTAADRTGRGDYE